MSVAALLFILLAVAVLYSILLRRYGLTGLTVRRRFSRPAVFEGDQGEMVEEVVNDRLLPVPWLRVETRVSPYLRFGSRENLNVSGDMYHLSLFTVLPFQKITRRHKVTFLHRGAYELGSAALTAGDLLGMASCTREQHMRVPVLVYPRPAPADELPRPLARLTGEWTRERQLMTDPFLYRGIRDYRPGDPVRDIHWPATARTGDVLVRVHDPSVQRRLMVLINVQKSETQWDNLMDYEQAAIEREISIAAALCLDALDCGLPAGFASNMPFAGEDVGREKPVVLMPSCGSGRREELLAAMARLQVKRVLSFPVFLQSLSLPSSTDVVVLSCYDSPAIREQLDRFRAGGCQVLFHQTDLIR